MVAAAAELALLVALLTGALIYIVGLHTLNRGNSEFVVLDAQDEVVVMAVGGALLAGGWVAGVTAVLAFGAVVALYGLVGRFTDLYDISGVV